MARHVAGVNPKPKGPSPGIPGCYSRDNSRLESLKKAALKVDINIRDLKQFKKVLTVLGKLAIDERIPKGIREEYLEEIMNID